MYENLINYDMVFKADKSYNQTAYAARKKLSTLSTTENDPFN